MKELFKELKLTLLDIIFNRRIFWEYDIKTPNLLSDRNCPIGTKVVIIWNNKYLKENRKIYLITLIHPETTFLTLQIKRTNDLFK